MPRQFIALTILSALIFPLTPGVVRAGTIALEAEHANVVDYPFEIAERKGASGGVCLIVPEGAGEMASFGKKAGTAYYYLNVPEEGTYHLMLRVFWNGVCSNDVYVRIGPSRTRRITSKTLGAWHWVPASSWRLKKGLVSVQFLNIEDGIAIDQVRFSTEAAKLGTEPCKTNTIPRSVLKRVVPPTLMLSTGGVSRLGPFSTRGLGHRAGKVHSLAKERPLIVDTGRPATLTAWLRNSSLAAAKGKIGFNANKKLHVALKPDAGHSFSIDKGNPLQKHAFTLTVNGDTPRRAWRQDLTVTHSDGTAEQQSVQIVRPYQWLVTNPLPCAKSEDVKKPYAFEERFAKGFPGEIDGVKWKLVPPSAYTVFGLVDMQKAIGERKDAMVYAYTSLDSPVAGDYMFDVRHDDAMGIWLNGARIFTSTKSLPSVVTRQFVKVKLRKGANHVIVKLTQRILHWEFGLQTVTEEHEPADVVGRDVAGLIEE